jgi:hypothetical protein
LLAFPKASLTSAATATAAAAIPAPAAPLDDLLYVKHESKLLSCSEVFVYVIPPLRTSSGHRAADWNLASPTLTASGQVVQIDDTLLIRLYQNEENKDGPKGATTEVLFAQCPIRLLGTGTGVSNKKLESFVEACVDSSRYFAIRCEDEKTKRVLHVGIGFRERDMAVDFKGVLHDYEAGIRRQEKAEASVQQQQQQTAR